MSEQSHDIEKYLRGELTPAEMHALEKRALDDPFLADALEGASQLSQNELSADLQSLHKSLNERADEKKVIPLWTWAARIAAGLILVAISTVVIINFTNDSKKGDLALVEEQNVNKTKDQSPSRNESASQPDSSLANAEDNQADADNDDRKNIKPEQPAAASPKNQNRRSESATPIAKPAERQEIAAVQSSEPKIDSLKSISEIAAAPVEAEKADAILSDNDKVAKEEVSKRKDKSVVTAPARSTDGYSYTVTRPQSEPTLGLSNGRISKDSISTSGMRPLGGVNRVTGRVTSSEDGTGLPGVNVVIKGTSTGTVTDINGNYQIEIPDPYATLVYSFIGLESMEMPVNNSLVVDASMSQDMAQLSEVVVTGFGEIDNGPTYPTFQMAEPMGGRRAFKKYLEDKLIYPQQAIANKVEGKVTIQFIVEPTGKLSNFNVVKGIGSGCDEELIRLIKQGPKWSATKRNDELVKSRVRVRMRFSLPKKK
jgi:TonB family protein